MRHHYLVAYCNARETYKSKTSGAKYSDIQTTPRSSIRGLAHHDLSTRPDDGPRNQLDTAREAIDCTSTSYMPKRALHSFASASVSTSSPLAKAIAAFETHFERMLDELLRLGAVGGWRQEIGPCAVLWSIAAR
jgi:hypothetical protein